VDGWGSSCLKVVAKRGKLVEQRVLRKVRHVSPSAAVAAAVAVFATAALRVGRFCEKEVVYELTQRHQTLVPLDTIAAALVAPAIAPPLRPRPRVGAQGPHLNRHDAVAVARAHAR